MERIENLKSNYTSIYKDLNKVATNDEWFEVFKIEERTYAIIEPYHFQCVISYLIIGDEKAILWDTGMNIGDISSVVSKITDKKVIVVNSHIHFDHIGNNYKYEEVYAFNYRDSLERLKKGYSHEEMKPQILTRLFEKIPNGFDFENFFIPGCNIKSIEDGHIFELGDRKIEAIHTPGHSPDSIMLFDSSRGMLFPGDSYYPGTIYAHLAGPMFGDSDIPTYAKTMLKVSKSFSARIKTIHPSHTYPIIASINVIENLAKALSEVADRKAQGKQLELEEYPDASLPDKGEIAEGYLIPSKVIRYTFEDFSILEGIYD